MLEVTKMAEIIRMVRPVVLPAISPVWKYVAGFCGLELGLGLGFRVRV